SMAMTLATPDLSHHRALSQPGRRHDSRRSGKPGQDVLDGVGVDADWLGVQGGAGDRPVSPCRRRRWTMVRTRSEVIAVAFRWLGRTLALLLFLFWGAFFLEHLAEWFLGPQGAPPLRVWVSQVLHLGMVVGLALMLRWDRLGALVTVLATT